MTEFIASNGVSVRAKDGAYEVYLSKDNWEIGLSAMETTALREFFQHEKDVELGRWRTPDYPDYVVKINPLGVRQALILHESSFAMALVLPGQNYGFGSKRDEEFTLVARAYFEAHHPRPRLKPWHKAKDGEAWALRVLDEVEERAYTVEGARFIGADIRGEHWTPPLDASVFTSGRRIWPESN